jgi:hypothetical protein
MTMIAEEIDQKKDSEEERRRNRDEAIKRGEETTAFIEKEIVQIDKCKAFQCKVFFKKFNQITC